MKHHPISTSIVPRETFKKVHQIYSEHEKALNAYLDQLLWWNKRVNLVSRDVPRETTRQHLIHSLLLSQFDIFASANNILDAGTGGGIPGIPLAITHPDKQFLLNDIVTKKCLAMKQMTRKIGMHNVSIVDSSVEEIKHEDPFLLISKHAFKINALYAMTIHLPWDAMVFYKGKNFEEELYGIDHSLFVERYDLSKGADFYTDKALVVISRE